MEETQLEKLSPPPDSALALRQGTAGKIYYILYYTYGVFTWGSTRIPISLKAIHYAFVMKYIRTYLELTL